MRNRTPSGYGWGEWQRISNSRIYRLWISFGWIAAFVPLGIALLIGWLA